MPNWDPGLRPQSLNVNQKKDLIEKGPCQPKLARFPPNNDIPAHKQRQFSSRWYEEYPHLEYSITKDAAFCFVCSLFKEPNQDAAWTEYGVSSWSKMKSRGTGKKGKLSGHFSSDSHREAIRSYARFCDPEDLEAVKTLAPQDIAFRGNGKLEQNGNFIQMTQLVARHCPLLDSWLNSPSSRAYNVTYIAPESQNETITLLADQVRQEIILDIKQAGMFSVSADTTPDLSKSDQMTVVCRFIGVVT